MKTKLRKWNTLAFISKAVPYCDSVLGEIGVAFQCLPTTGQDKRIVERILEIARETFPKCRYRIVEYERVKIC